MKCFLVSALSSKHHHHILSGYFLSINHPQFTILMVHSIPTLLEHYYQQETINFIDLPLCRSDCQIVLFQLKYFLAGQWVKYFLGVLTLGLDPRDESWCELVSPLSGRRDNYRSQELSILPLSIPLPSLVPASTGHTLRDGTTVSTAPPTTTPSLQCLCSVNLRTVRNLCSR